MFEHVLDWLTLVLGPKYRPSMGQFVDGPELNDSWIAALYGEGGPAPSAGDRHQRFKILLLGPIEGREHASSLSSDAQTLLDACDFGVVPCGAANIRAIAEPIGPGYTAENRAWYSMSVEVQY